MNDGLTVTSTVSQDKGGDNEFSCELKKSDLNRILYYVQYIEVCTILSCSYLLQRINCTVHQLCILCVTEVSIYIVTGPQTKGKFLLKRLWMKLTELKSEEPLRQDFNPWRFHLLQTQTHKVLHKRVQPSQSNSTVQEPLHMSPSPGQRTKWIRSERKKDLFTFRVLSSVRLMIWW